MRPTGRRRATTIVSGAARHLRSVGRGHHAARHERARHRPNAARGRRRHSPAALTAKDSVEDLVRGLDTGADDYLTKPFEIREFAARVRALLRRHGAAEPNGDVRYNRLTLNTKKREAAVDGEPLELTHKEFELLLFLLRNREQILTRDQLFSRVWGLDTEIGCNVVDVYIYYLRRKLKPHGYDHVIQTVRNVGYMLKENRPCSPKPGPG